MLGFLVQYRVADDEPWRDLTAVRFSTLAAAERHAAALAARRDAEQTASPVRYRVAGLAVVVNRVDAP